MNAIVVPALADLLAIAAVAGFYFSRHGRRDLFLAFVALNVGVMTVTAVLAGAPVGAGLGLGLFGILSIIRLRSDSITQEEVAYYFVALALGLVTGLHPGPWGLAPALCAVLVAIMYVADHPALFARSRRQLVTIDAAIADERELRLHLAERLGVDVTQALVQELDFVRDLTIVDVRYRLRSARHRAQPSVTAPAATLNGLHRLEDVGRPDVPARVETASLNGSRATHDTGLDAVDVPRSSTGS